MDNKRALGLLICAMAMSCCSKGPGSPEASATPSAEAKAYVQHLRLAEVSMKATESYAKQVVTEIEGKVTNTGDQTVEFAELACVFHDSLGQVVLRERVPIIRRALKPGETRAFRLPFDDIPASWDNQLPSLVISQLKLS